MVEITGLFTYPVKSCRGIAMTEAEIGPRGFLHDREFLVVDDADQFLTQRTAPDLATVDISTTPSGFVLTADAIAQELHLPLNGNDKVRGAGVQRHVTIFNDQMLADDVGDDAAEWFSAVLHRRCRVVRIGAASSRKVPPHRVTAAPEISFTDAFPTFLASEESLADLNSRLAVTVPMNRFRPNIVVRGCAPYEENTWESIRVNDVILGCAAPCLRCIVTTTDQETGKRESPEPLRTLATYRRGADGTGVIFGVYLVHSGTGKLRVGDCLVSQVATARL